MNSLRDKFKKESGETSPRGGSKKNNNLIIPGASFDRAKTVNLNKTKPHALQKRSALALNKNLSMRVDH